MSDLPTLAGNLPEEQQAIRAKCFHPSGMFVPFEREEIEQSIPERFEKMVRKDPDRIALQTRTKALSYRELNRTSNRVAYAIMAEHGPLGQPIALLLENDGSIPSGMLGVMKSGNFFVILDPSHPAERNAYIMHDSRPGLIVTDSANLSLATTLARQPSRVINLDMIASEPSEENPGVLVSPDAIAHLIYTSGSTGQPKGVLRTHRNELHYTMSYTNFFHACEKDRISLLGSPGSGQFVMSTWWALLNGAALCPLNLKKEGLGHFADWLVEQRITILYVGVAVFRSLAGTLTGGERFPNLRLIRLGSEVVWKSDVESFRKHFPPNCLLANALSISETGVVRQCFIGENMVDCETAPVGYTVEDKDILLFDEEGREKGLNCTGEIAVRSRYLSPGYWQRPDLTATKFLPDPNGGNERIYLTGDKGRMRADGCLEYMGRKDFQVKVRGYTVEVAEIETRLMDHPALKEAVVTIQQIPSGSTRLVAYFVLQDESRPSISELIRFLKQKLPDHMIPSAFVTLDGMPLTFNGKIDRDALPAPGVARPELETPYVAPRTPIEAELTKVWAELLSLDRVGIHDDFFELGGHSLLAAQMLSRLRSAFQVELSPRLLFDYPTVAGLASQLEEARRGRRCQENVLIQPVPRARKLSLSFAQQRLWFLNQLDPNNPAYNQPTALRLSGKLDIEALQKALNAVVARHDVLRTNFLAADGITAQVARQPQSVDLPLVDFSKRPEPQPQAEIERILRETTHRPFNLSRDLMLRAALVRLGEEDHILLLVTHHIVSDGWSSSILWQEISSFYKAFAADTTPTLRDLPIQYADFGSWQRQWLQGEVLDKQLTYWKKQLAGIPSELQVPTDRPRPAVQTFQGSKRSLKLAQNLSRRLKVLSREKRCTLFMTLLAAFQVLLHRYTGQDDVLVGSPVANRTRVEVEPLIGFFANTLVLRADLSGNPTFLELLGRVREVCLEAYSHQDLPFEKLVEELQPERDLSRNPLFQVMFQLRTGPRKEVSLPDIQIKEMEFDVGIAKFDLYLAMADEGENFKAELEYNTDLFDTVTIERMLGHLRTLLEGIAADPDKRLLDIAMLTDTEKHQLLVEWNKTKKEYPRDKTVHQLFEEQVERTPDAAAIVFGNQRLTYRELDRRANQLAHYLRKLGVGPEVLVGICMERSLEMIVSLLGVLKAGGAYVPLDPAYPKERLAFMLEDTKALVLITQQKLLDSLQLSELSFQSLSKVLCPDTERETIVRESENKPISASTADNLAYVIYTSGSTGKPKGVGIPHRGVVRLVKGASCAELTEKAVFFQFAPLSFDASTFEIWGCLLNGARLVLFAPHKPSVEELGRVIRNSQVTTLWLTSALFQSMVEDHTDSLKGVEQLLAGGDVLSASHVARILKELPGLRLINGYGPTENTTFTCCYWMTYPEEVGRSVSIGRPVNNTQVYLLDTHLNPVPIGVPGELYIGGDGLARGYLDRPELTAERFIPNPLTKEAGARIYRTGDLARYLPDGNIEFLGRIDHQVKIRGFRIELGEIEAVLSQHPAVREAVVLAREYATEDRSTARNQKSKIENPKWEKRLVAYVVPKQKTSVSDLRGYLKQKLPEYMIPSVFVLLEALPMSPNGKTDRKALPAPDRSRPELEKTFVAPRTPVEETLGGIWSQLLGVERVGIHDDFFELGGHSLLATQVISRVHKTFEVEIPLRALFENPTVAELAAQIVQVQARRVASEEMADVLSDLESLSDEEAERLLARELPRED